ncbi:LysR family transcriptional regulator [Ottowia thiooxydans]|uniref:LysR family transcriptional regulator n=1 Tax=Ottowia thiooxydans TaxID=219182 RepID=UPI0003F5149E|nr:LysR family transcriptional regulator [Ottowia thiooxydans]
MSTDRILELTALVRSVELGSFTSAARELGLTASALSKIITKLESRLGVRLLHRTSRSLALTPEGDTFVAGARRVLEALSDAEGQVSISLSRPQGKIRIYSLPAFAYRLAPILSDFLILYPELTVDLQLGTDRLDLIKYGFDLAIRIGALEDSGAFSRKLCETEWIVCASPDYLAQRGTPMEPSDLSKHNCLNFSVHTHTIPWQFRDEPDAGRPSISGNLLSNHAELLRLMAVRGVGIIRVADHVIAEDLAAGRLIPVLPGQLASQREPVWAVHRNHEHMMSLRVRVFLDYITERLGG